MKTTYECIACNDTGEVECEGQHSAMRASEKMHDENNPDCVYWQLLLGGQDVTKILSLGGSG